MQDTIACSVEPEYKAPSKLNHALPRKNTHFQKYTAKIVMHFLLGATEQAWPTRKFRQGQRSGRKLQVGAFACRILKHIYIHTALSSPLIAVAAVYPCPIKNFI
jgi:hypothetical protein